MPDQQPPQPLTETELSARLHHLAAHSNAPVLTTGAQVRNRAVRRRRGRRAALCTTALVVAALITVTSGVLDSPAKPGVPPAASASRTPAPAPSRAPVQRVKVDLDAHTMTIGSKRFRIAAPASFCPIGETAVTVTAKYPSVQLRPGKVISHSGIRRWAVTFTDRSHHQRLLMFGLDPADLDALGADAVFGAVGLAPKDGKEVYDTIRPGARVEINGGRAKYAQPDSVCVDRQPVTGAR
ncbi:hypothetical protein ABZ864_45755 [Streptomyces sp. NPDC047082]|uniref:hypothetical protein n=1 Tax=Streptomyces sp. NPDC047082 TaxID=3155259 RepID=UPI00340EDC5B